MLTDAANVIGKLKLRLEPHNIVNSVRRPAPAITANDGRTYNTPQSVQCLPAQTSPTAGTFTRVAD